MYVKVTSGSISQFPYTIMQLRRDNANTSFPKSMSTSLLQDYGVYAVVEREAPDFDRRTQKATKDAQPSLVDGEWVIDWTVSSRSSSEISDYDSEIAAENRTKRDGILSSCDWTQMNDSPLTNEAKTAWATYRQELRDITDLDAWPNLEDADWPVAP